MSTSRRTVLLQGGVIGAGLIAAHLPGAAALAAQAGPPLRRSLQGLAWNDPIVATYRDAVGIMKRKPASDPLSWVQLAGIHGSLDTGFRYCPHGNWYFLPWHRAFTTMYERIVRHLTRNDDFALPYWDWTTNPLMPAVFLDEKTPDGKPNWLCVTDPGMKRTWNRTTPMPADICGRAVLTEVLNATPYEVFGTSRPRGQNSLDPSWVTTRTGVQGRLEATPHNLIHNNIGGWMPSPASPRDPIFFMHHGNIDRIWTVWNLRHANSADPLWTGMTFKDNFRNPDGTFWSPKVSDLFVPEELGYTYGTPPRPAATAAARTLSLPDTLSTVLSAPPTGGSPGQDLAVASVENSKAATPAAPLTLTVPVPEASLRAVRGRVPVGSGLETMDFTAAQERAVSGTRALAILRDVAITDPGTTAVQVYLGDAPVRGQPGPSDPRYVGTFAVLDHSRGGHGGHGDALPSFVLDLTDPLQRVAGLGGARPNAIGIQIVPVAAANGKPGTATPRRIEVVFVTS